MSVNGEGDRDKDATEIDASFAAIVAGWGADEPSWPSVPSGLQEEDESVEAEAEDAEEDLADADLAEEDEGHYEPPEPPPIPRPQGAALGALVLLAIALVLLFVPGLVGLTDQVGLPLGLLAGASGIFWLFLLLRTGPPTDSGWDDGSRL